MANQESWRLKKKGTDDVAVGWYGGHPRGIRAQDWPRCRVCSAPMCHMAQIDVGPWLDLGPFRRMSVFICHATGGHCEDWDPQKGANRVILHRDQNNVMFDGPPTVRVYRRYMLTVEASVDESALLDVPQEKKNQVLDGLQYDKLGGVPVWIHRESSPVERAGRPLKLALQMTTDLIKFDITSKGMAYVFREEGSTSESSALLVWQGV